MLNVRNQQPLQTTNIYTKEPKGWFMIKYSQLTVRYVFANKFPITRSSN